VTLSDLIDRLPQRRLEAGTALGAHDFTHATLLVVRDGVIVTRTAVPGSSRRTITCNAATGSVVLPPGEDEKLVALTDATIATISANARDGLMSSPDAARLLVDGLVDTLKQKHDTIAGLSRVHHVDRVRGKLIELARDHGRVGRDGIRLDFPVTHDLLGEMVGSARETVTRALDELQREGFVVRRGRTYSVQLEPEQLASS
jgi:hypothetical protein